MSSIGTLGLVREQLSKWTKRNLGATYAERTLLVFFC